MWSIKPDDGIKAIVSGHGFQDMPDRNPDLTIMKPIECKKLDHGYIAKTSAQGENVEIITTGVYDLPKLSSTVITAGTRVSWMTQEKKSSWLTKICTPSASRLLPLGTASPPLGSGWMV